MKPLQKFATGLADLLFWIALGAGALMMTHVTVDVISRTLFNHPLPGTGEITASYYMIAVAFLPLAWVSWRDQHVTADLFVSQMGPRLQKLVALLTDLLAIAYVSTFVWQTWLSALSKTRRGEVWEIFGGYLPIWPTRWLLPIGGAAMVLVLVIKLLLRLSGGDTPRQAPDAAPDLPSSEGV
ncbi:TRAP transporter small permease [Celeribacter neptunius]|uniref:TRAP transporter small permease protein n=1 Tax=Celeribacter neptunius TaxID=588602 RepID=A0A1I3V733_9RHOB|nr:TRAP transporter small permease [Celeribacter neptunius]SFJ90972.1 TRAP-type C4-dicarboxylate transport system, small permease component [Celeribacter neptunius]